MTFHHTPFDVTADSFWDTYNASDVAADSCWNTYKASAMVSDDAARKVCKLLILAFFFVGVRDIVLSTLRWIFPGGILRDRKRKTEKLGNRSVDAQSLQAIVTNIATYKQGKLNLEVGETLLELLGSGDAGVEILKAWLARTCADIRKYKNISLGLQQKYGATKEYRAVLKGFDVAVLNYRQAKSHAWEAAKEKSDV